MVMRGQWIELIPLLLCARAIIPPSMSEEWGDEQWLQSESRRREINDEEVLVVAKCNLVLLGWTRSHCADDVFASSLWAGWSVGRVRKEKSTQEGTQSEPIQMLWLITNKFGVTCQCWWWWWRRDEIGRPETSHSSSFVRQCDKEGRAQLYDRQTNETYERGSTFLIGRKEGKQLSYFHHHHQHWLILLPAFLFLCKLPPAKHSLGMWPAALEDIEKDPVWFSFVFFWKWIPRPCPVFNYIYKV